MKKILAILFSLVLAFSITACGTDKKRNTSSAKESQAKALSEKDYIGKYLLSSLKEGETEIKKGDDSWDESVFDENALPNIELKKGKECSLTISSEVSKGTYKISNGKIAITIGDDTVEGAFKDNKITLSQDGTTMVFEKK